MATTPGLSWTIKDSLVSYVEALDDGMVEALAPASRSAAGFWFPLAGEAAGSEVGSMSVELLGTVRLTGHWGALDVELRDPRVELDGRRGTLLIRDRASRDPQKMVPFAELAVGRHECADDGSSHVEATASLTGHGRLLLGGQYRVGEPLSPLRMSLPPRRG
ncbi:HtaA domain-containing protein [Georgenia sp. AZ-5]|uniref:HtaA domain-containing protein n=1 Tax=Georgenia sp. AZ-5 TaxID=3367526 RepID=UPI003753EA28